MVHGVSLHPKHEDVAHVRLFRFLSFPHHLLRAIPNLQMHPPTLSTTHRPSQVDNENVIYKRLIFPIKNFISQPVLWLEISKAHKKTVEFFNELFLIVTFLLTTKNAIIVIFKSKVIVNSFLVRKNCIIFLFN